MRRATRSRPAGTLPARQGPRNGDGGRPRTAAILELQATAGNRAVSRALRDPGDHAVQRFGLSAIGSAIGSALGSVGDLIGSAITGVVGQSKPMLKKGAKGNTVRELQELLVKRGAALVVDGDFGPKTDRAVREFQGDHGLVVDGVAGPMTWGQLIVGGQSDADPGRRRRNFAATSPAERADWTLLGGIPQQWNDGEPPGLQATTVFEKLTDAQKAAAVRLGYTKASWDAGREGTADRASEEYTDEEAQGAKKSGGTLPAKWAGSLRSRSILDAEFGHIKPIDMPKVKLLTDAETKATYEGFYGKGSYPAGGLEGFERDGTNYLNMASQSADTVIHEMLHTQEHTDWDGLAYAGVSSIGEGATEMLTKRAATRFEVPTSTSYPDEHRLVEDMNTHSSQETMMNAYFLGGSHVTTYRADVEAGLVAGKTWADFKARIDASDIPGARAMLT